MILPLAAMTVSITVNGVALPAYRKPYLQHGRVMAPVEPYLLAVATSVERTAGGILARRGDRFTQCSMRNEYVPIAPLLEALGVNVRYDAAARMLAIVVPPVPMATATPFNVAVPRVAPTAVFTPVPADTPRPSVSAKPQPRRTPLPMFATPAPASPKRATQP